MLEFHAQPQKGQVQFQSLKTIRRPLGHINFTLSKSSKNTGINIEKLDVLFKYSVAYKKHVIIVAL